MTDEEEVSKGEGSLVERNEDIMVKVGDPRASMFRAILEEYDGLDGYFKSYIKDAKAGDRERDHSLQRQLMDKIVPSLQAQALIVKDSKGDMSSELKALLGQKGIEVEDEKIAKKS